MIAPGEQIITDENGKRFVVRWRRESGGPEPVLIPEEEA